MQRTLAKLCFLVTAIWVASFAFAQAPASTPLRLGIMPYLSTRTLITTYQPLASALEISLKHPVHLITAPDYDTFFQRSIQGEYDLMIIGPHFGFALEKAFGYQPILINKAKIQSLLLSPKNLPIDHLKQLKGHTIAVADTHSMMALQVKHHMEKLGLQAGRDYEMMEAQNQLNALQLVLSGKARAAILFPAALNLATIEDRNQAVVYSDFPPLPGLVYLAKKSFPAKKIEQIQQALFSFESSPEGQVFIGKTGHQGFRLVSKDDRQSVQNFLPSLKPYMHGLKP